MPKFRELHPDVTVSLNLSDRIVDIAGEGYDCAVRVGDMPDSSLVSVRLADNRRLCVATPAYLARHGTPQTPAELAASIASRCPATPRRRGAGRIPWGERRRDQVTHFKPGGPMDCSDGQVLRLVSGRLRHCWRSTWEVESEITAGQLVAVLEDFAAPLGIYAVFPQRKHMSLRVRLWIDFLKEHYGSAGFWRSLSN